MAHAALPAFRRLLLDEQNLYLLIFRPVGEPKPHTLGDGAWICGPRPEVDRAGIAGLYRVHEVRLDLLQGASPANEPLGNVRRPRVHRHTVEAEAHPVLVDFGDLCR